MPSSFLWIQFVLVFFSWRLRVCMCVFFCLFCGFLYYNTLRLNKGLGNTLDTQRVGDQNVTPMAVLSLIECELINADVHNSDAIDGSLVTTPIPGGRTKLGA